jgi:sporulation protein YlmC with PRC-barrel domain
MGKKERLKRDIAGVGPEPRRIGLSPLRSLPDFRIAKGEPDIRGWTVRTLNGSEVGKVDDLLVDQDAGEVVMMDVEMRASERHLQLPIRTAQLDHESRRVIVDSGDVQRYGSLGDIPDDRERQRELDRYFSEDRERERARDHEREVQREHRDDLDRDRVERDREDEAANVRGRTRDANAIERDQLAPDMRNDADEVIVERRPVIEEVVVRRRVVED